MHSIIIIGFLTREFNVCQPRLADNSGGGELCRVSQGHFVQQVDLVTRVKSCYRCYRVHQRWFVPAKRTPWISDWIISKRGGRHPLYCQCKWQVKWAHSHFSWQDGLHVYMIPVLIFPFYLFFLSFSGEGVRTNGMHLSLCLSVIDISDFSIILKRNFYHNRNHFLINLTNELWNIISQNSEHTLKEYNHSQLE